MDSKNTPSLSVRYVYIKSGYNVLPRCSPIIGGLWRTINGGTSWAKMINFGSMNPQNVYFYNSRIGYINRGGGIWKTTDGGFNWFSTPYPYGKMYFFDSLYGYKTAGYIMSKTTNGGMNWTDQQLPNTFEQLMQDFTPITRDTIFGTGGYLWYGNNNYTGIVYKTINGGINWGYQIPLNNYSIVSYSFMSFANKYNGWAYRISETGVHTTVGGSDTTIFTDVNSNTTELPKEFELFQNYPNPFNSETNIIWQMQKKGFVSLKVFDITGKEVSTLINEERSPGKYYIKFDAGSLRSGVYFCIMKANGVLINTIKLIYLK